MLNFLQTHGAELLQKTGEHLAIAWLALLMGLAVAVPAGLLLTRTPRAAKVVMGVVSILQTVPSLALLAFMIPFLGVGKPPAVMALFVYSLLPILRNTWLGIRSVDPGLIDAARGMGMTGWQQMFRVEIPLGIPVIMAGIRLSAVYVIAWSTLAAYIGAGGLGDYIFAGLNTYKPAMIVMGTVPVTLLALLTDFGLGRLERRLTPRHGGAASAAGPQAKKPAHRPRLTAGLLVLILTATAGCAVPCLGTSAGGPGITVAGGNTSERQILAEIMAQQIRHELPGVPVTIINNLGSSTLIHQAMLRGDANLAAAMYTGTSLTGELGLPAVTDPDEAFRLVQDGYAARFDRKWYDSYGFQNTYAFMITRARAERDGIRKVSDLAASADRLRAGVDTSWMEREGDGYQAFLDVYGFDFGRVYPMEIGLVYNAVQSGEMDVVLGYTTDGRIQTYDLVILEDDRHLFPPYDACPVAAQPVLEAYPELDGLISRLTDTIDTATMQQLNRQSDEDVVEPYTVARRFLEDHRYFEPDVSGTAAKPGADAEPSGGTVAAEVPDVRADGASGGRSLLDYYRINGRYVLQQFLRHFLIAVYGVLIAALIAIPLGVLLVRRRRLSDALISLANIIQTVPSLALMSILMLALGLGTQTVVTTVALYAFLPILKNTCAGVQSVPPALLDAAKGMGMTTLQLIFRVELPLALSVIMGGIRNALVVAIGITAVGTFIGAGGLGDIILRGVNVAHGSAIILAGALPTAIMAIVTDLLLGRLEKRLAPAAGRI